MTEDQSMTEDQRRYAPATARNREPILAVLQCHLPSPGLVLEIASGTGEHATYFAQSFGPGLVFQPTDPDPAARTSIDAWTAALGLTNVRPAFELDATCEAWPVTAADAVLAINMVHISPWSATEGLVRGAARKGHSDYDHRTPVAEIVGAGTTATRRTVPCVAAWRLVSDVEGHPN